MPIDVTCSCGKAFGVPDSFAGKAVRCPACRIAVAVPKAAVPPLVIAPLPRPPVEPASYSVVAMFAWLYLAATGLWLLVAAVTTDEKTSADVLRSLGPALGAFFSACLFAPWSFLAVDAARTLRSILEELRRK